MKETPDYEKFPVSDEEMGQRYKNWMEALARQVVALFRVGKEVGGEQFVQRLRETFRESGCKGASRLMSLTGSKPEDFKDCSGLAKVHDYIDDRYANFWGDYVENSPKGFEKELNTCPIAKYWSKEPDLCEILFGDSLKGFAETLNPKFQTSGFTKLLTKGDKCCRYRIEMKDE